MTSQNWKVLNWLVQQWMNERTPYRRGMAFQDMQPYVCNGNSYTTCKFPLYYLSWPTKYSKLAAKNIATADFHQDTWNCFLMLAFVSAHISKNIISNQAIESLYTILRSEQVLLSASAVSNICWREYSLTMDTIYKQLPSRKDVSLDSHRWTSTKTLAIMSVSGYYMDPS